MRIGAVTMAYRDEGTIRGTLSCLAPFVDQHVVMMNTSPYNGKPLPPDKTEEIVKSFPKVDLVKGQWPEHVLRNIGHNQICKKCDWVIGFDADEMMTAYDMKRLLQYLAALKKAPAVGLVSKVYWHSTDFRFDPDPDHVKVCITRPGQVKYIDKQCVDSTWHTLHYREYPFITHHHLSYCAPKNIREKVMTYAHADEFDGAKWYDKHFKNWKEGDPVVQPFGTTWEAVRDPLPEELRVLL